MKEYKVGASIIYHPDYYIMHRREPGKNNGELGKLGLYGGQFEAEKDKTITDTAKRELHEESGILFPGSAFHYEDYVFVVSERDGQKILTEADIFLVNLPHDVSYENFEDGVPMTARELSRSKSLGQLTSVAAAALTKIKGI